MVFEKLKADARETPSVALYYGLLLSAAGDTNQAAKYLGIAQKSDLLPEEKALAAEALKPSGFPKLTPGRNSQSPAGSLSVRSNRGSRRS